MGQKRKRNVAPPKEEELPPQYEFVWSDGVLLRLVKPYKYCFRTFAKARWIGRSLHEVCATEFGARTPEYYREAIVNGRLRVDGQTVLPDYVICNGDAITHETSRHEPPVLASVGQIIVAQTPTSGEEDETKRPAAMGVASKVVAPDGGELVVGPITIVSETEELVGVDKPPTVPVHPSGAYHHNTLLHILSHEQPKWQKGVSCCLHAVHRLDRLTSGLVLLAKTPVVARRICAEIAEGKVRKEYLARVRGRFPRLVFGDGQSDGSRVAETSAITCDSLNQSVAAPLTPTKPKLARVLPPHWLVATLHHVESAEDLRESIQFVEQSEGGDVGDGRKGDCAGGGSDGMVGTGGVKKQRKIDGSSTTTRHSVSAVGSASSLDTPQDGGGLGSGLSYTSLTLSADGAVRMECPLRCVSHRDGVHECHPDGRSAVTIFSFAGYDAASDTSLIRCTPLTGRTHQIRVHLLQLGFPIANDPCYGGDGASGNRNGVSEAGAVVPPGGSCVVGDVFSANISSAPMVDKAQDEGIVTAHGDETTRGDIFGDGGGGDSVVGTESKRDSDGGDRCLVGTPAPAFTETQLRCRGIWLHALRYSGPGFSMATSPPPWARGFEHDVIARTGSDARCSEGPIP
eukprot:TRINITY_DN27740_c0_g1_i1.p1 TRINITY_DN27740_c0_g1~~TRINITY_DN27740_c0_g1_i1.p1  ORF type:complete len:628 (-),score=84.41 TRINITY_DN27740_c0_g1_i1:84-1967(-)